MTERTPVGPLTYDQFGVDYDGGVSVIPTGTPLVTGAEVLTLAGTPRPDAAQTAWADMVAAAITSAVAGYLGAYPTDPPTEPPNVQEDWPGYREIKPAAELAALELYKRREAPFGATSYADAYGQAIRLSRDYLGPIMPTLRRWHPTAGVVAS